VGELINWLRQLSAGQREVLALHYIADLSVADIAANLGIPEGTVKARLSRGRSRLAELLADEPEDHPDSAASREREPASALGAPPDDSTEVTTRG